MTKKEEALFEMTKKEEALFEMTKKKRHRAKRYVRDDKEKKTLRSLRQLADRVV